MTDTTVWRIPEPISTLGVRLDDGYVTTLRRYGNADGRRLILSHGNGLAIDLYYPFWSLFLDDFDVVVFDLRNHGRNPLGPIGRHNIATFVHDLYVILDTIDGAYGAKANVGVFHSLSALIALLSMSSIIAERTPSEGSGFTDLVLFDPPLFRPHNPSEEEFDRVAKRVARQTRKRGNRFAELGDFLELLRYSTGLRNVVPGVHRLMAETTLRKADDGAHYVLRCPPEYEARLVEYARSYSGMVDLDNLPCRVKALGADPTLPSAYLPSFDLEQMDAMEYDFLPDATHYLQLEKPEDCAAALREFLERGPV